MSDEVDTFSRSVRQVVSSRVPPDHWMPGRAVDDHSPELSAALADVGWPDLAMEGSVALPFLGAGAVEMGRAAAPFVDVLFLLGGSPLAGGLAMYGTSCRSIAVPGPLGYSLAAVGESQPVNFADSLGVHVVTRAEASEVPDAPFQRIAAWETATVGYLAGLADASVTLAIEHARNRQAFGATLAQIETVQQRLADAATRSEGLVLSAREGATGLAALAHAASAVGSIMTHCHQVLGAIGFCLESAMPRYSRRAKALASFADSWIDQRMETAA